MSLSLDAAVSGMVEQQRNMELIANNLANVNTTGYKRLSAHFQDVLDNVSAIDPLTGQATTTSSQGGVASGTATRLFAQGSLTPTARDLDFAISGDGFFKVRLEDGTTGYTRDGTFTIGVDGRLASMNGYPLEPPVQMPLVYRDLKMNTDGSISVTRPLTEAELAALGPDDPRDGKREVVGQITLARFRNPTGLISVGNNLYTATAESQEPIEGPPAADGMGVTYSGWLESSNVDIAVEMTNLSLANRSYILNFTAFKTIEEMLRQAGQIA